MTAIVKSTQCVGCGKCEISCPEEAILVEKKAYVIVGKCRGCGSCTVQCDHHAIILVK